MNHHYKQNWRLLIICSKSRENVPNWSLYVPITNNTFGQNGKEIIMRRRVGGTFSSSLSPRKQTLKVCIGHDVFWQRFQAKPDLAFATRTCGWFNFDEMLINCRPGWRPTFLVVCVSIIAHIWSSWTRKHDAPARWQHLLVEPLPEETNVEGLRRAWRAIRNGFEFSWRNSL